MWATTALGRLLCPASNHPPWLCTEAVFLDLSFNQAWALWSLVGVDIVRDIPGLLIGQRVHLA